MFKRGIENYIEYSKLYSIFQVQEGTKNVNAKKSLQFRETAS